ncbi:hypothetical protein CEXT_375211 [Caerostris extrusa]|uniref:Uncharacterized protein n=1 Tax=Caerostris extrusa TaxID=172846 RepID=A0AAV4UAT5_CAEEX|nr:hypothetical protein CEXT_375211 [Caerostris extrusa]
MPSEIGRVYMCGTLLFKSSLPIYIIYNHNFVYQLRLPRPLSPSAIPTFPPRHIRDYSKVLQLLAISQILQDLFTATTIYKIHGLQIGVRELHPMTGLLLVQGKHEYLLGAKPVSL